MRCLDGPFTSYVEFLKQVIKSLQAEESACQHDEGLKTWGLFAPNHFPAGELHKTPNWPADNRNEGDT